MTLAPFRLTSVRESPGVLGESFDALCANPVLVQPEDPE